jgi:membrane protein
MLPLVMADEQTAGGVTVANRLQSFDARGRRAAGPEEIPKRGWKDIFVRVKDKISADNLSIVAAGVAFYAFLAIFPALAALVSIYGLLLDPASLQEHMRSVQGVLPSEAAQLVNNEIQRIASQHGTLGWALIIGIILALWSAAAGMKALFQAMNIAYDEDEKRGFLKLNATALLLTLGAIVFVILFLGLIILVPAVLSFVPLGTSVGMVLKYLRWPLLAIACIFAVTVVYRYGPSRAKPQWKWITWGAAVATILWLVGSGLFSLYVTNFASYNKTYGALAVVVMLMMWLLLSAYSILLGAEINAEMEHQTTRDTTAGAPRPMGARGARVADTLGREAENR